MTYHSLMLVAAVCFVSPLASTRGAEYGPPLTVEETRRLEEAQAAAKKLPEVKAAVAKYNAARKAHQLERDKFPADRVPGPSVAFRQAEKELNVAMRKAILARDPALGPLLDKAAAAPKTPVRKPNEGETVVDSDVPANSAVHPIQDVPGLPRVLLIGDSISIGYTLPVRAKLKDKANVHRIPVNGGATEVGLANMQKWLGDGPWDVIHFNFGLHDAKYMSAEVQRATREQYAANLRTLVDQMKKTGAKLVFATTTPVPNGGVLSPTRKFDSIEERNKLARAVMAENGVAIDDLYQVVADSKEPILRPGDVHFTPLGYEMLAEAVAAAVAEQLPNK